MPTGIPFGYRFQGSDAANIIVQMIEKDDGKVFIYALRSVVNDFENESAPTGKEFWFDADHFRDLRNAVETIAWHMDQVQEHGYA